MIKLCISFVAHNTTDLHKTFNYFTIGRNADYFDEKATRKRLDAFSEQCYLPTNAILLQALQEYPDTFKCNFALSNTLLQQLERYRPDVLASFVQLFATDTQGTGANHVNVEAIGGLGEHSLASLYSKKEFMAQSKQYHAELVRLFHVQPKVFLNTEMIYSNAISDMVAELQYTGILTEGTDNVLGWRSPNFVYQPQVHFKQKLLFRNSAFSNMLAFKFADTSWSEHPLSVEKFTSWFTNADEEYQVINLVLDYETFGYYQPRQTGILEFLAELPKQVINSPNIEFSTLSNLIAECNPVAKIDVESPISWSGNEQDLSPWQGNELQKSSLDSIYALEPSIKKNPNEQYLQTWRALQCSDYFRHMDTRWKFSGYNPHDTNNFESPEEAYIVYNNIVNDLALKLDSEHY